MGSLKTGVTYVYERVGGIVYARELGSLDRFEIGRDHTATDAHEEHLWKEIYQAAKEDPVLQELMDRVKITYYLRKENGQK